MPSAPIPRFLALIVGLTLPMLASQSAPGTASNVSAPAYAIADDVSGEWRAKGADPGWNGRFVLHLTLQQLGDSVTGTYAFEFDGAGVSPVVDVAGSMRDGNLQVGDRGGKFWLTARLRRDHLDGRLAGGERHQSTAIPISLERVH